MKKKPEIKHVWFDVGNVIVRASHEITHAILRDLGVAPDKTRLFFQCEAYREFSRGKISPQQFAEALRKLLKCRLSDEKLQIAHDAHIYIADENMWGILRALEEQTISLAFITNTNIWQTDRIEGGMGSLTDIELPIASYDMIVRSHEIGALKTDSEFWPRVLSRAKTAPEDTSSILFIDDSPANIAAARAAGLQTYLFDPTYGKGAKKLRAMLKRHGLLQ